ncbi:MAG: SDR family NAD(P)-dependent oxidoreductase [Flavobacteriaceae bacterium]
MNKLAVIIGAGPGIGFGVAEKFGSRGFKIALVGRTESGLKKLSDNLNKKGIETEYYVHDASDEKQLRDALGAITDRQGEPEIIHYNAAHFDQRNILDVEWDHIKNTMDTNLGGAFNLIKNALPGMMQDNRGKLFFTGGGFGLEGEPDFMSLSLGKAALRNLVQAAHKTADKSRVHVGMVTVCGFVNQNDPKYNPAAIAEQFWNLYEQEPDGYSVEFQY